MVRSMWLFKHKFHADGTLSRYKARLVTNDSTQQHSVDFDETFSPVVKSATIRTVLSLDVSRQWPIHQLDVKNAFLNGDLSEIVYMHQPPSFDDSRYPNHVCLLQRSLYGLKQARRAWFQWFAGLFLSQKKYALQLLEYAHMVNCNPSRTPVDTDSKLGLDSVPVQDPTLYHSLAGGLQYLTFTHPNLSYVVQQICLYMHNLRESHFDALKRILHYIQGTLEFGLHLYASATTSLVGYTDADWAGCPSTRRSTSGYCVFLGDNLLLWSAKRQHTISCSSIEAEYRGVANVVAETAWIRNLLSWSLTLSFDSYSVYCDNVRACIITANDQEYTRLDILEFRDTLIQNMDYVKKSIEKRALHKMEYDSRVNERLTQTTEEKVDSSKVLDDSLVIIESNGTESQQQDTSSRSGNDAHVDDADIRPIYNEEPVDEVQTTAEINVFAIGQQHTEQPELNNEGEVDQNAEQCHDTCPLPATLTDNQTTKLSNQSLESENIRLKNTVAHFQKLEFQNHGLPPNVDVNKELVKPVTTHHLPKGKRSDPANNLINMIAPSSSRYGSNDIVIVSTRKIFTSSTTKVESEPPNGSNVDITNQCESKQALNVSVVQALVVNVKWCLLKITLQAPFLNVHMTFKHSSSSLGRQCQMASAEITLQAPFLNVQNTFDYSRSSLGLHGDDVYSHQFRPRSSSNDF
ncbi:ribonuclease H-like domain-containing protein [Tanacetum coccineum]